MERLPDILNELVIQGTRIGVWNWNIQTGETYFNNRWAEIIGYTLEELGPISIDTWVKFAHPDDLKVSNTLLERHFRGEVEFYDFHSRMLHKNGQWVWVHDRGRVFEWDLDGKPLLMCGSHIDITEMKEQELRLTKALKEKEVLLAEVHHRVKNNLQLLQSIARLKQNNGKIDVSEVEESTNAIALAYEAVYRSEDFGTIDTGTYLNQIARPLLQGHNVHFVLHSILFHANISTLIPIGLIVMECIGNSLKHGFAADFCDEKRISINVETVGHFCTMVIKDNGQGIGSDQLANINSLSSYGVQIIRSLAEQIDATVRFDNEKGARVSLTIPIKSAN